MSKYLSTLNEFDIIGKIKNPHLLYLKKDIFSEKKVAYLVLSKKEDEILLINSNGFREASVLAGLSEKNIGYIAAHAPLEYKTEIMKIFNDKDLFNSVWEIANAMDDDLGHGSVINKNRIKRVIQYMSDNREVFQF